MDKQGAMSTSGKASGLKPPSKIVRPSGVPSRTSPSSGKKLLKKKNPQDCVCLLKCLILSTRSVMLPFVSVWAFLNYRTYQWVFSKCALAKHGPPCVFLYIVSLKVLFFLIIYILKSVFGWLLFGFSIIYEAKMEKDYKKHKMFTAADFFLECRLY